MKIEKIIVSAGFTVNMGNYESARFDAGTEATLEENDNLQESFDELFRMCRDQVKEQVRDVVSRK